MRLADMTVEDFRNMMDEFYAPAEKRSKLTHSEALEIAEELNEKINIPILSESKEEKILLKIILKVDGFLYNYLPNEIYDLARSLEDGISDEEAKRLIVRLSKLANEKINIPYIPETFEYYAIRFVIGILINAARKEFDIAKAVESIVSNENIPSDKDADDTELEKIIDNC